MRKNFAQFASMKLSPETNNEIVEATLNCYNQGLKVDDVVIGEHVNPNDCTSLKEFCKLARHKILHETGAVVIQGLNIDALGSDENIEKLTECSRIAYFLISSHIGIVDASARGRVFDVKNANIDAK